MKKNINESNTILLKVTRDLLAQETNSTKYPGLTQLLTEIETRAKAVVLTADELSISEITAERQTAEEKLDLVLDAVKGIAYIHQKELLKADWLKRGGQTHKEFFQAFFAGLQNAPELIRTELVALKSGAYADYAASYQHWQELLAKEEQRAVATEKINEAIDIRAGLMGLCRMLGMTGFDIERSISD